jgi:hypothetical protein
MGVIRHPKDFVAGLLFAAVGVAAIVIGSTIRSERPRGWARDTSRAFSAFC